MRRACGVPTFTVTLQPDLKPHEGYPEQFHALSRALARPGHRIERHYCRGRAVSGMTRARACSDFYRCPADTKIPTGYLKAFHCCQTFLPFSSSSSGLLPAHRPSVTSNEFALRSSIFNPLNTKVVIMASSFHSSNTVL